MKMKSPVRRRRPRRPTPSHNTDPYSLLSRPAMLEAIERGDILYVGGSLENIKTVSIDLRLGPWYWEETALDDDRRIFNPLSRDDVNRVWGRLCYAPQHWQWIESGQVQGTLPGFQPSDRMFLIRPGCLILCQTMEFTGGISRHTTTMLKARSGGGRSFLEICRCAGWGDIGFCNRWTMEVCNSSSDHRIPLKVGQRLAQLVFFRTRDLEDDDRDYRADGVYQSGGEADVRRTWSPEFMRPALYRDAEVPGEDAQRLYYRCRGVRCGHHGEALPADIPERCECGGAIRVFELVRPTERVFPLFDVCIECCHVYHRWEKETVAEVRETRSHEEREHGYPLRCVRCDGYRHFLGGEYEVRLPDMSRTL